MNSWQELVTPKNPLVDSFPECALVDLSHLGLIRLGGPDLRNFLQGQVTNDVRQVTPELAQLSSHCSPKGRMLGNFWIIQRGDDLYLQLPAERVEPLARRLRMFVLRAQVEVEDASQALARCGIAGECAVDLLPFVPAEPAQTITRDGITVLRLPGDRPRFEVLGPPQLLGPLWQQLNATAVQTGSDFWTLMDIRAGIPSVYDETADAFVPQMTNLQLIGGVSFTKGCYTGQEVVARMQYLGTLKRRMYRVRIDGPQCPAPGMPLYSEHSESGQGAGRIVAAAPSPEGGFEALAVIQISSAEADELHLVDAAGPRLQLIDLPYAFPAAED
jgi:folate-binding protein YgfZ